MGYVIASFHLSVQIQWFSQFLVTIQFFKVHFMGQNPSFYPKKNTVFSSFTTLTSIFHIFSPRFALFCSPFPWQGRGTRAECAGAALVGAALYQALGDEVEGHKGGAGCHDRGRDG